MFVKFLIVATILCTLQCSVEVHSFEIIRNAIKNVATKVHNFVHPNHKHTENCKHSSHQDEATTSIRPVIDIRGGPYEEQIPTGQQQQSVTGEPATVDSSVTPNILSRSFIDAPCTGNSRKLNGECRTIVG